MDKWWITLREKEYSPHPVDNGLTVTQLTHNHTHRLTSQSTSYTRNTQALLLLRVLFK